MRRFFATRVLHPMPHLTRCELLEGGYWAYVCFGGNGMRETIARESLEDALGAFRSLDFYVVMFGLALCRAWIVLCLSAPFVVSEIGVSDWLFLIPGALSTLAAAFVAYRVAQRARFDRRFKAITGAMVGVCVLGSPVVVLGQSTIGMVAFMVLSGVASSCLQVLWGVGFARRKASFSLYCYPSSAIVTAVLVAIVLFEGGLLRFASILSRRFCSCWFLQAKARASNSPTTAIRHLAIRLLNGAKAHRGENRCPTTLSGGCS